MGTTLDQVPFGGAEFAENPEPRCPCILLLDTSGSMKGEPIAQLNEGLVVFKDELTADPLAQKRVEVALKRVGARVELTVDDDGPGIPQDSREEAFRPFHRLDESRNLQTGGVGLGLAIARDIARAHGGDVTLAKGPLGGLRAIIRLPV